MVASRVPEICRTERKEIFTLGKSSLRAVYSKEGFTKNNSRNDSLICAHFRQVPKSFVIKLYSFKKTWTYSHFIKLIFPWQSL